MAIELSFLLIEIDYLDLTFGSQIVLIFFVIHL